MRSGLEEAVPYSLSRWTDVPAAKWGWFEQALLAGKMQAFDPRTGVPDWWSLAPEHTQALVFWTKDPQNLVLHHEKLKNYNVKVHVTITGWSEVEHGAPVETIAACRVIQLVDKIGVGNVTWRFSPVPLLPDPEEVTNRFRRIARLLSGRVNEVYLSFLQPNDRIPETRTAKERISLMWELARIAQIHDMDVLLCNEDRTLSCGIGLPYNLRNDVCVPPSSVVQEGQKLPPAEACGCAIMIDPFTINEKCSMACEYCYAADQTLSRHKRNTTKSLPVLR